MGQGFPIVSLTKHKITTWSSTESELVGVNDMMSLILWTQYFLNRQGYKVKDNFVFQDNKSTVLLERNGKSSSGKRTKQNISLSPIKFPKEKYALNGVLQKTWLQIS